VSILRTASIFATFAVGALAGCRGDVSENAPRQFLPDMDDQPKVKAQTESTFYAEYTDEDGNAYGRSMRPPVPGTVPFGREAFVAPIAGIDFSQREELLRPDDVVSTGRVLTMNGEAPVLDEFGNPTFTYIERIPIPVTAELVRLGEKKFNIFCMPCHGQTGAGDGLVGERWSYALPTFHQEKNYPGGETGQDGLIFHIIRNGVANPGGQWPLKMPSYARKLSIEETWAVVAYIRALQINQRAKPDMLPENERLDLQRRRSAQAPSPVETTTLVQEASR
jgi:mono/diheme cytochrome c family protein